MSSEERNVNAGQLKLRMAQYGETCMIQLDGELDLANAAALEQELDAALRNGNARVIVDMSELTFIDSTGIALLVTAAGGADGNGDGNGEGRVRFLRSRAAAVNRVLDLTGVAERLPFADASADGDGSSVRA
ncbi:MAG TPA: STAS domain-containing protein [Solirubrobacterales bacterium]|nr:STAS domain-containing protein [Solirubrobacterales bacterium]